MDDISLFASDAAVLEDAREKVRGWLMEQRGLLLNPKRWHVLPAAQPSTYLGYRVSRAGVSPGRKARRRMRDRVAIAADKGPDALRATLESYRALVLFG